MTVTLESKSDMEYLIRVIVPQYYGYAGFSATKTYEDHDPSGLAPGPAGVVFTGRDRAYWVTAYLRPTTDTPGQHSWGFKINDFGVIAP